jgi:ZIP family zinc transporter
VSAFAWGVVASSSLLVGGALALTLPISKRALGLIMAFGAGVLISAVAYDLVQEAQSKAGGSGRVAYGLMAGALTFFLGDAYVDRAGGQDRKRSHGTGTGSFALPVVLGIVLDGIPESIVIGLSLLGGEGVGVAVLAAVFLSNLPEAMAASTGLRVDGWRPVRIMGLWGAVALVCGVASLVGYRVFDGAGSESIAFVEAFAGGAILTMLADTMMPEAFEHGGKLVGLLTTLGFGLAFLVSSLA